MQPGIYHGVPRFTVFTRQNKFTKPNCYVKVWEQSWCPGIPGSSAQTSTVLPDMVISLEGEKRRAKEQKILFGIEWSICHYSYYVSVGGSAFSCQHQLSPSCQGPPCATQQLAIPLCPSTSRGLTGMAQICSSSPVLSPPAPHHFPGL